MNNKEFLQALSSKMDLTQKQLASITERFGTQMVEALEEGDTLNVQGFGQFEVRKRLERVSVRPDTGERFLVPPKLALTFKPADTLKEKANQTTAND